MNHDYPILPYCLYHGKAFRVASVTNEEDSFYTLSCPVCTFEEVIHGQIRKSVSIVITEAQSVQYTIVEKQMVKNDFPGLNLLYDDLQPKEK